MITLKTLLSRWNDTHRVILTNATAIVGTTGMTSVLGVLYWLLAARAFSPTAVGLAAAALSAMTLLGNVGVLGIGTLLTTEFPRHRGQERSLLSTALLVTGLAGGVLGFTFAIIGSHLFANLRALGASGVTVILFALGVSLSALTLVLDDALIGLLRSELQFARNMLFAVAKLGVLLVVGVWVVNRQGMMIYATWAIGNLLSVAILARYALAKGPHARTYRPRWGLLRKLGGAALRHHALNLVLQAPSSILPLLVAILLSTRLTASFYVAWMVAGFVFVGPRALTSVLYAASAVEPSALGQRMRFTLSLALLIGLMANLVLLVGAEEVLRVFGRTYAEQAGASLRILALAVFPLIIKDHYITVCRLHDRVMNATRLMAGGAILELLMATAGAVLGGLSGLCASWLAVVCLEAVVMCRVVYRAAVPTDTSNTLNTLKRSQIPEIGLSPSAIGSLPLGVEDTISAARQPIHDQE